MPAAPPSPDPARPSRPVSRGTILRSVAWSAPVVAAVAAAPLAAASPTYTYRVDFAAGVARPIGANVPAGVPPFR